MACIVGGYADTDTTDGDTQMNGIWNSPNNQPTQTHTEAILADSKPRRDKDQRPEDRRLGQWISQANSNTCTTQCMHYQTQKQNTEIFGKLNHNIRN